VRTNDCNPQPGAYDEDVERLSNELKQQVKRAKARISDRYGKLMEPRSFATERPAEPEKGPEQD
jgi:hypothetical protein